MDIAYFDCFSGASGDMILGALVAAGWPAPELEATLCRLPVAGWRLLVEPTVKQGLAATQVFFELPAEPEPRRLGEHLQLVSASSLPSFIKDRSLGILRRLGETEARVHGFSGAVEDVHLHELGSLDTVFDIVGSVAGLAALAVDSVHVSPLNLGAGMVKTAHGSLPVPAPAVAELVQGLPVYGGSAADGELLTPTGAAILSTLGTTFGPMPPMTVSRIGMGAGRKSGRVPNVLRLWLGRSDSAAETDEIVVLETNIDDMNPELYGPLCDRLLAAGALDAYLTPVIMKKGRPAIVVAVLCPTEKTDLLADIIFEETTTLGIRTSTKTRRKLERHDFVVATPYGTVRVKVGRQGARVLTVAPEFEDCRRLASEQHLPLKQIYDAARQAFANQASA